ncbi:MAG TPA: AAA family ATPase, partial [Desulfosarcina sp.]|nr:AAA family ATPase [Desulfosarcina sp.]
MMTDRQKRVVREPLARFGIAAGPPASSALAVLFERWELSDLDLMTIGDLMRCARASDDPELAAMLGAMFVSRAQGSLCLRLDEAHLFAAVPQAAEAPVRAWLQGFLRAMDSGRYDTLIDRTGAGAYKPLILDAATGRRLIYFQKFHFHEQRLKRRLASFPVRRSDDRLPAAAIDAVIEELYADSSVIRSRTGGDPIMRDPFQMTAIRKALTASLLVVSGGPGTGKTSLLANLLRALVRTGTDPSKIVLTAPTGRAAQRMTEALAVNLSTILEPDARDRALEGLTGSTMHKLLVYNRRTGGFVFGPDRPLAADVVAVDEVSMVDVVMMDRLFQAIDPARTRVMLIGDKDQLPSVEAGSVLADLNPAGGSGFPAHFVELAHVYRSSGQLLDLAHAINQGREIPLDPVELPAAMDLDAGNWAFVAARSDDALQQDLDHWAARQYLETAGSGQFSYVDLVQGLEGEMHAGDASDENGRQPLLEALFQFAHRCRVLTVMRRGP